MTNFIPHTPDERQTMLETIGVAAVDDLFAAMPGELKKPIAPKSLAATGRDECDLQQHLTRQAALNIGVTLESFQGGGAYARFIPPAVNAIASRSEFYTAYTPYQPEVSQGTLQMVYEFQTMMSELTGLDITNASVYDAASAVTESALMALRATRRKQVYCSQTVNPQYRSVLETYFHALGDIDLFMFDPAKPLKAQVAQSEKDVAAVILQIPDYYGGIADPADVRGFCEASGAIFVAAVDPVTLSVLTPPGAYGAQIACGDIQQFGNPVNYGGPYGGFIATTEKLMRQLPGRIVGRSLDKDGQTAYTLTLQTREQHIRRGKATSNICTNQSLNVLKASVYMSLLGPQGLKQLTAVSAERAHQLAHALTALPGVQLRDKQPFLYEFAVTLPVPASRVIRRMAEAARIIPGIDVGKYDPNETHTLLVAVTELNSPESLDRYISAFRSTLAETGVTTLSEHSASRSAQLATGTMGRQDNG